nr:RagB/SusD family nutrient uptake outer membrane protein [Segetibacter koreensis]
MVLSNIDKVKFSSDSIKTQYIEEMKFIRACMYFNLVSEFGDVPVVTEALSDADQATALTVRAPREKVYTQIVQDLKDVVSSNLPVVQSLANKGRVSMQAANGLLGQVYLTMATTLDPGNAATNLENAKAYLTACYNMRTFANLSDLPFPDVFDANKKGTNPEIIWQIVYVQGDPVYSSNLAANNQAKGETINSMYRSC